MDFLYKRQQFLVSLIKHLGKEATATDLQKIVFSYCKNKNVNYYDFVPYKFGAYSFQLTKDYDYLTQNGYVDGSLALKEINTDISIDTSAIEELRGKSLVRKTYKNFPYFAINSEIAEEILNADELNNVKLAKEQLVKTEQKLFSIGYEGKSVEEFINILLQNDIQVLCDVRFNPKSMKYGFSSSFFKNNLEKVGIQYVHIQRLGIESNKRQNLGTEESYSVLFLDYEKTISAREKSLKELLDLINSKKRVAIMCFEHDKNFCHRNIIKNWIANNHGVKCEDL